MRGSFILFLLSILSKNIFSWFKKSNAEVGTLSSSARVLGEGSFLAVLGGVLRRDLPTFAGLLVKFKVELSEKSEKTLLRNQRAFRCKLLILK